MPHKFQFVDLFYIQFCRIFHILCHNWKRHLQYAKRKKYLLPMEEMKNGCINIDGFNLIITLEVALSGSVE